MLWPNEEPESPSGPSSPSTDRRILLFDLSPEGQAHSIRCLARYWNQQQLAGSLDILVQPQFLQLHPELVKSAQNHRNSRINFFAITAADQAWLGRHSNRVDRKLYALRQWSLVDRYARLLNSTACLFMNFDQFQLSAALRRGLACSFSGLYWQPRFHYSEFQKTPVSRAEQWQYWRERLHIKQVLQHSQLRTLFCPDPFAVACLQQFHSHAHVVHLPEPIDLNIDAKLRSQAVALKATLEIEPHRYVLLLLGNLDAASGVHRLLEAIKRLTPELCRWLCLLLVNSPTAATPPLLEAELGQLAQTLPVQIIQTQVAPEQEVQLYFQLSDVIALPYLRHVGSSEGLIRAAAAQKPVLASDYGLLGEWTQRHQLGLAIDSRSPDQIAQGLGQFLQGNPIGDRQQMQLFAQQHSPDQFARVVFKHL